MLGNARCSAAGFAIGLTLALLACFAGCGQTEKIETYRVDKPEALAERYFHDSDAGHAAETAADGARPGRMLGAIVPHGSQFWFFKLAGPDEAVKDHGKEFLELLFSVHFADGAESPPDWTLPEGWTAQPGNQIRYATLEIAPGPPRLEVSVTTLPKPDGKDAADAAVLSNVNRWRGQMGLPPIDKEQLADQTKPLPLGGETATFVSLVGKLGNGGMGAPPFAGGPLPPGHPELPPDHPPISQDTGATAAKPSAEAPADLTYDAPAGWKPGQLSEMRKAAFVVEDGSQKVEITVVALPPFAGDLLSNVNRWRGQLHLPETTAEEVTKQVKPVSIDGAKGSYIDLVGPAESSPQKAILGAMATVGDHVWFIKLIGDAKLADREKPKFDAFLKSIKFAAK